jgi:hypothetical protein
VSSGHGGENERKSFIVSVIALAYQFSGL